MAHENLKTAIKQVIKSNNNQEITGNLLQNTLLNMVDALATANVGIIVNHNNKYSFDKTNNTLSFSGLTDVYSQLDDFYRINSPLSLTFSGNGSSGIFFNTKTKALQENYSEGCLLVGAKAQSYIYLYSSAIQDGDTRELGNRFINIISRVKISASLLDNTKKTVVLSRLNSQDVGYIYYNDLQTNTERHFTYLKTTDTTFNLSGDQCLVLDTTADDTTDVNKWALVKNKNNIKSTDIVLFICDGLMGLVPGCIGYEIVQHNLIRNLNTRIENLEKNPATSTELPNFISSAAISTFKRLLAWVGTDSCYTIAQITDVHSGGNEKYKHVGYLNKLNSLFNFNLLCNSGDVGLDVAATATESAGFELMYNTKRLMDCSSKWIFCKGNHDHNEWINTTDINNIFCIPGKKRLEQEKYSFDVQLNGYGYIDEKDYKLRIFYLNTSEHEQSDYKMSLTQIQWLINSLKSVPANYKVVILTHYCAHTIGKWNAYPMSSDKGIGAFTDIMKDFVAKKSGSNLSLGVTWDFTNTKGTLVCNLCGDSHFDNHIKQDGVNYIVRQGYGGVSDSDLPSGAVHNKFDYNSQCCFDILAIKDNKAKIFRIGVGDSTADIEFTF